MKPARLRGDERVMTEVEAAWFAGWYEGEGSLTRRTDRRTGSVSWELAVSSTDEDVIRKAHAMIGVGNVQFVKRQRPNWSDKHRLLISRRHQIAFVLDAIKDHLGTRRRGGVETFLDWYRSVTPDG